MSAREKNNALYEEKISSIGRALGNARCCWFESNINSLRKGVAQFGKHNVRGRALVKNQVYGGLLGDVEAIDDAAEEAAAAYLKGRTLADEIAALAALTVDDANELLRTALREENRAYVQIDPAE